MLEIAKVLLQTKSAEDVMKLFVNTGMSKTAAAALVCDALKTEKIKMEKVVILWSEGLANEDIEFNHWQDVNILLSKIAREHDKNGHDGSYSKTKVQIYWADGETYTTRLDVNTKSDNNINKALANELKFYTGLHKPAHMTQQAYETYLKECDIHTQSYVEFLEKYEIE